MMGRIDRVGDHEGLGAEEIEVLRPHLEEYAITTRRVLRLVDVLLGVEEPLLDHDTQKLIDDHNEAIVRAQALEHSLATANAWIAVLQGKIAEFEDEAERGSVYATVGLVEAADDVVVAAARRALLAHLHPDRAPSDDKNRMSARFAQASAAFDRIWELRRC